ncbi:helix-turn-helix transcriptional regulator [Schaalia sp. JY-X169]|uniref:helix-turn-helix domain-containing protein n=1 Tax=Schaalia sp. JY-X169 TaxID=2758572 RepID=UPI0015F6FE5A|nr:helix-turn-helix transcriptional regulator [Schaalia sp. JY-X169]
MAIRITIDRMLAERGMSVGDFAEAIGITPANVAVLKNGRAKAVRFTTLDAICRVLECQPGDILRYED